jgi:hypothetical protein
MSIRRERSRLISWLGIVAVLSNILASVLCMAPPARAAVGVDDILGPLVLCTEHGPETALDSGAAGGSGSVSQGGSQGDGQGNAKSSHCTACTLLAGLSLLVAFVFAVLAFPVRIVVPFMSAARTLPDHLSLGGIRSRAPPLSA